MSIADPQTRAICGLPPLQPYERVVPEAADVPFALRERRQWVCARKTAPREPGGKPGKMPVNPRTGDNASTTDPSTWGTFDEALARLNADTALHWLGFVFTADDPFVGIDLDKCRDPATGELADWARVDLAQLDTYTEVSPGLTGVHAIGFASLSGINGRKRGDFEWYSEGRFFTFTGLSL